MFHGAVTWQRDWEGNQNCLAVRLLLALQGGHEQLLDASRTSMDFPCSVYDSYEQLFPFLYEQEGVLLIITVIIIIITNP